MLKILYKYIIACVTQLANASDTQAVGHGFKPRTDNYNRSYNNI